MSVPGPGYEIILRRHIPAKTEMMSQMVGPITEVFTALDRLALVMQGKDDHSMELTHALADLLRGYLVKAYGVDFCPTNDLGPHEEVELSHSLAVLFRLMTGSQETTPVVSLPEAVRKDLCRCFLDLERHAYLYRETVRDGDGTGHPDEIFAQLERNLAKLRTSGALWLDDGESPRPAPHILA